MATITVNGTALPECSKLINNVYMIGDSKRSASGVMNVQYIANKRKYDVVWGTMTASQLSAMMALIKSSTPMFSLVILDPSYAGGTYTGTFYAGDAIADYVKITSGVVVFHDIKISLIEC